MIYNSDGSFRYTLTRSSRAKHVRLKMTRLRGLEVVVPPSFKLKWLPPILEKREAWITRAAEKLKVPLAAENMPEVIPSCISLCALGETFHVRKVLRDEVEALIIDAEKILRTPTGGLAIELHNIIYISSDDSQEEHVALLRKWLIRMGKEFLPQLLEKESFRVQIPFSTVQVRLQKTRWGSCSSRGGISLNARLLLLPEELLRYILLHELAHRKHPNHSQNYWDFLQTLLPDARTLDARMQTAWEYLPVCFALS
ncbi:MAG: M48 family metallopeptidase [Desulfovibrionales bacterium]|nr:M48 family metallopeptidase [Desulfovibrionales bacterium]